MQNPKTGGNRFNPDIRPSEIDTYTETNGEQTAEYKIINAHPIINGILNKLAFFRTHAAAVYYNRLANKTVKQKFDDVDAAVSELNEKLGTKKVFKTYFVGSDKSLWNVFKEILSSSDSFSTIIFNQPQENVFSEKGLESGVLTVYYSVSYWANHLMYNLQDGTSVYTGIINAKDNQIMSFAQQITKDYVDDRIKIIDSGNFAFDSTEANGNSQKVISFRKAFNKIPNVVICPSSTANPKGREMATIDVTKTGFTATLHNASGEVISPYATWIAIGS